MKNKVKEEQKKLAQRIKECRPLRKPHIYDAASEVMQNECISYMVDRMSWEYRHKHIAYCQFFNNTPYSLIENPRQGNEPNKGLIEKYMVEWSSDTIRNCA